MARAMVLVINDGELAPLIDECQRDLLEIVDDRHGCRSAIITSLLPVPHRHTAINALTLADEGRDTAAPSAMPNPSQSLYGKFGIPQLLELPNIAWHIAHPDWRSRNTADN